MLVAVLLIVLIFIFASYGVHLFGMRFASCNDRTITDREECVGVFRSDKLDCFYATPNYFTSLLPS